jgi:predicted O-methyltransferase YrrM
MRSSYIKHNYGLVFSTLCSALLPQKIIEIGILDGYSLEFLHKHKPSSCTLEAYDLFDDFPHNAADYKQIKEKYPDIVLEKGDYYNLVDRFPDGSIDILHIDVANDGDVYRFAVENYLKKISPKGIIVLEGGSSERDEVDWMRKYNKTKINPYLQSISDSYCITILEDFPSLTLIKNHTI